MNFIKRALLAVTRRRGKSFIMFVIFAAIANMVLAGLAIQHATDSASVLARQKLGGELTLSYNLQKALQQARAAGEEQRFKIQPEPVTEEMVKQVAGQENIVAFNCLVNANGVADGFEAVVTEEQEEEDNASGGQRFMVRGGLADGKSMVMPDVTVTGISATVSTDSFKNGDAKVVSGRGITPEDAGKKVALIEKNLAQQNKLKVGSKIKIKATRADDTVEYSVVGIYDAGSSSTTTGLGMKGLPFTEPYNRIFVDYKSALPLKTVSSDGVDTPGGIDQAVFYVDDPKNIDKVKTDVKAMKIDWEKYILDANDLAYQQMMGPIENVASFSKMVVYIVAVAGAVILALVLMLFIKERMYETGVLLAMGEGKFKVIAQYMVEVLVIAVVAFGLSVFSGNFIAQGVGNKLLQREISVIEEQENSNPAGTPGKAVMFIQGGMFGRQGSNNNVQPIDSLNVKITTSEVERLSIAGLLIIVAGTILPAATIMRYKPRAILTGAS